MDNGQNTTAAITEPDFAVKNASGKKRCCNSKQAIMTAAFELIKLKGYDNVTVDEICEKCGLTKGSFYHHFNSKESLLDKAYIETDKIVMKEMQELGTSSKAADQFKAFFHVYAVMMESKGVEIIKQIIRINLNKDTFQWVLDFNDPVKRPAINTPMEILQTGQKNGELRNDIPPAVLIKCMNSIFNGTMLDWCYHNGSYDIIERMDRSCDTFLELIKNK